MKNKLTKSNRDRYQHGEVPITTNGLSIKLDFEAFRQHYTIVSYADKDEAYRNIPYADMVTVPHLSVFGMWYPFFSPDRVNQMFFILCKREEADAVITHLNTTYPQLHPQEELFKAYPSVRDQVVTSLALNSLISIGEVNGCYSDGKLLLSDPTHNFGFRFKPGKHEILIGLELSINRYLNLIASTKTITKVWRDEEAVRPGRRLFCLKRTADGMPATLVPCTPKWAKENGVPLTELFYIHKAYNKRHAIPLLPFASEKAKSGRLFMMYYAIEALNRKFENMINVQFKEVEKYLVGCNFKTSSLIPTLFSEVLSNRIIGYKNPFKNSESTEFDASLIHLIQEFLPQSAVIKTSTRNPDAQIHIVEQKECEDTEDNESKGDEPRNSYYAKGTNLSKVPYPIQHAYYTPGYITPDNKAASAKARRILVELCAKLIVHDRELPQFLASSSIGWEYIQYKQQKGRYVHGVSMSIDCDAQLSFRELGLSNATDTPFCNFVQGNLGYAYPQKLKGYKDYKVLRNITSGNTYVIIDSDEIGLPNARNLESAYELIDNGQYMLLGNILSQCEEDGVNAQNLAGIESYIRSQDWFENESVPYRQIKELGVLFPFFDSKKAEKTIPKISMFKNKDTRDHYLGSYYGVHAWSIHGLEENTKGMAYLAGKEPSNINTQTSTTLHTAPHVRLLFSLTLPHPELQGEERQQILDMLQHPFGMYDESGTYPLGFKLTSEYLEHRCLELWELHWTQVNQSLKVE